MTQTEKFEFQNDDDFYYPSANNLKALVIGNSFASGLVEFLPYSFKRTVRLFDNFRYLDMDIYEAIIEEYKPDIVVLNFQTAYLGTVLKMYDSKQGEK